MAETIEAAYQTWRRSGQNVEMTLRELAKQGYTISKPTIYEWTEKYGWKDRATRAEIKEKEIADVAAIDATDQLIADLEKQKAKYDRFFDTLGDCGVDNQATYAYTALVKTISEVRKKASEKPDLYAMTPMVMDEFVKFIKAKATEKEKAVQETVFDLIDRFFEEVKPDGV
ncbi:MAG: hypothetical protein LBQ00_06780 [Syntrophobacterales bacterium]|nr:hypothetical protein [Syntrophobacterales bacterium]